MEAPSGRISVSLFGRFRVETADGTNLTPNGTKAQGLLALLATSASLERGRTWLQDKLWSDRSQEQGAASLRQALSEIRRAFGPMAEALQANRTNVSLQRLMVALAPAMRDGATGEFLEGIDVRDPEFEEWLRLERSRPAETGDQEPTKWQPDVRRIRAERPAILFVARAAESDPLRLFEDLFIDCVSKSLREVLSVDVFSAGARVGAVRLIRVTVQSFHAGTNKIGLRASVEDNETHLMHWSGLRSTTAYGHNPIENIDVTTLGIELIDALADLLSLDGGLRAPQMDANMLGRLAIRKIFSMRPAELVEADDLLRRAGEFDPRGVFLAWRAQLRVIQDVELHPNRSAAIRDEIDALCREAMDVEPSNSMVLAAVANARLVVNGDVVACLELAKRSVEVNPANPLAWDSLSTARLYAGQSETAHLLAVKAQRLASTAPHRFWWDMGRCLTAALTGRAEEALHLAEVASALSPEFRPPLRYLTALYAAADRPDLALRAAARLKELEPDFSFERMAADPAYPISPLRRSGLLQQDRLRALGN